MLSQNVASEVQFVEFLIGLVIAVVSSYICYTVAKRKGFNEVVWAVVGFVLPLIGLIIVAVRKPKTAT